MYTHYDNLHLGHMHRAQGWMPAVAVNGEAAWNTCSLRLKSSLWFLVIPWSLGFQCQHNIANLRFLKCLTWTGISPTYLILLGHTVDYEMVGAPWESQIVFFDDGNVAEGDRVGALALWQNSLRGRICFVQNLSIRAVVFAFFQHRKTEKHHWLHYSVKKYGWWTDHHKTSLVMIIKQYSVMLNHKKTPDVWWCLMLKSEAWDKKPVVRSVLVCGGGKAFNSLSSAPACPNKTSPGKMKPGNIELQKRYDTPIVFNGKLMINSNTNI